MFNPDSQRKQALSGFFKNSKRDRLRHALSTKVHYNAEVPASQVLLFDQ